MEDGSGRYDYNRGMAYCGACNGSGSAAKAKLIRAHANEVDAFVASRGLRAVHFDREGNVYSEGGELLYRVKNRQP